MTEAMSRHEIEDVLSSIRRLVSHEDRAAPTQAAPAGKLVLTSELRVDDGPAPVTGEEPSDHAPSPDQGHGAKPPIRADAPSPRAAQGHPGFANAPLRATPPTQRGQASAGSPPAATLADAPAPAPAADLAAATDTTQRASGENPLEATLARLEEALAIAPTDSADQSETVIDEDALSEMVARMVRQELQGELGERITRNIRKLVRAEVARELQMRNL